MTWLEWWCFDDDEEFVAAAEADDDEAAALPLPVSQEEEGAFVFELEALAEEVALLALS